MIWLSFSRYAVSDSFAPKIPAGSSVQRKTFLSSGQEENTGVCCHLLLQQIFPTQGLTWSHPCLLHCRRNLYHWTTWDSPVINTTLKILLMLLFSCQVVSNPLWPQGLQHARLPCPSLSPRVCSNPFSSRWCHLTISSSVTSSSSCPENLISIFYQHAG